MAGKRSKKRVIRKRSRTTPTPPKEVCFVIMPFGGWLDEYYDTIYRPAIEAAGLEPHRADDLFRPSTIVNDIWDYTKRAKLLVADLTGKNPNVFYELGLAHALAKPAILIAESMEDIPFDLRALRIIVYNRNDPRWGELLQEKVSAAIREVLQSPQEAVLPAFLSLRESASRVTVTAREKDIIEIKQELDLLRRELRIHPIDPEPSASAGIGPSEAKAIIRSLLIRRMPQSVIVSRLKSIGASEPWIRRRIREIARELREEAKRLSSTTATMAD